MTTRTGEEIKGEVRDHYSQVANNAAACCDTDCYQDTSVASNAEACCDTACCDDHSTLYTIEEIRELPSEAVLASAGCGNPTALASLKAGETVVDFGSGGGIDCFLAARAVGPEGKVIGVDMTPDMVALARANAEKLELSNVEFHLTDMESTPLSGDSADVVISNCVICLAPNKDAVFQEAFRILRPGGRVFLSDMVLVQELPKDVAEDVDNWVSCLGGTELKDTYLGRLSTAGFDSIEVLSENPLENSEGWRAGVRSMIIRATKSAS